MTKSVNDNMITRSH